MMESTATAASSNGQFDIEVGRKLHAQSMGVDVDRVSVVRLELDALLSQGTLIDVDVKGIAQFMATASFEELGIPIKDMRSKRYTTGKKYLIPHDYLSPLISLETQFRTSLLRWSLDIEGFRPWRYLKATAIDGKSAYENWREEWEKLQGLLSEAVAKIITDYPLLQAALVADFSEVAEEAWTAIRSRDAAYAQQRDAWAQDAAAHLDQQPDLSMALHTLGHVAWEQIYRGEDAAEREAFYEALQEHGLMLHGKKRGRAWTLEQAALHAWEEMQSRTFKARIVAKALGKLPSPERIQETVKATYRTGYLLNQADVIRQNQQAKAESQAIRQKELALSQAEQKMWAMRQAEMQHAREQLQEIASPFSEVMSKLKTQIYDDVMSLKAIIDERGYLPGRAGEKAKGLRELYNLMALQSDAKLEEALKALDTALIPTGDKKVKGVSKYDVLAISSALLEIANQTHASTTAEITDQFSGWNALELD